MGFEHRGPVSATGFDLSSSAWKPALVTHNRRLWCMWENEARHCLVSSTLDTAGNWSPPHQWDHSAKGTPGVAVFNNSLHLVYTRSDSNLVHYTYNDAEDSWAPSSFGVKASSSGNVSLAAFEGKLFCVFRAVHSNELHFSFFDPKLGWSESWSTGHSTNHDHDLCAIDGGLWVVFSSEDSRMVCIQAKFQGPAQKWSHIEMAKSSSAGFSWDSSDGKSIMAWRSHGDQSGLLLAEKANGQWSPSLDPFLADIEHASVRFFNSMVICVWAPKTSRGSLQWARMRIPKSRQNGPFRLERWMAGVLDDRNITELTIPGTHNSHATYENCDSLASGTMLWTVCQGDGIHKQMEHGARYIDLRVREDLKICHGSVELKGTLESALAEIKQFLIHHPSEIALISVKLDDGNSSSKISSFVQNWWSQNNWYHEQRWPTLGEVRGKAILLKRYGDLGNAGGYGIPWNLSNHRRSEFAPPWYQQDNGVDLALPFDQRWERGAEHMLHAGESKIDDGVMYFTTFADTGISKLQIQPDNVDDLFKPALSSSNPAASGDDLLKVASIPKVYADYMKKQDKFPDTMEKLGVDPNRQRLGIICWDFLDERIGSMIAKKNY